VNIKIAGKWMFIPLKMVLIGIDPYPYQDGTWTFSQTSGAVYRDSTGYKSVSNLGSFPPIEREQPPICFFFDAAAELLPKNMIYVASEHQHQFSNMSKLYIMYVQYCSISIFNMHMKHQF
jgi:hypothetical protein